MQTKNYQTSLENVALNTDEEFNAWCNEFGNEVLGMAKRHTGNPKEGDYLKYQIGATTMNFSGLSSNVFKLSVVFTPIYYTTVAQEEELDTAISNLISELNLSGKSDYEKVKVIYDYYCSSKNTNTFNYNLYL